MTAPTAAADPTVDPHFEKRWLILGVIAIAQLLVVLDATIVNIALPDAQDELGFSDANRQWVITSYALAFAWYVGQPSASTVHNPLLMFST